MSYQLLHGDCRELLATLPADSFDSIVTDPPYGLSKEPDAAEVLRHWLAGDDYKATGGGFMGKTWDSFVPGPATWREVLRVLKPGGHALVFAGARTQDLMTMSLRLAGFEIRDSLMWIYGSGFPKSFDVSKAVERAHGIGASRERALKFTAWMRSTGITARQINEATDSSMGSHYLTDREQPAIATLEMYARMLHLLPPPPDEIMELMQWRTVESENMKRREVVGSDTKARSSSGMSALPTLGGDTVYTSWDITAPHTDAAKQWDGWGTALKPAYEPIILVRKPLIGTVADNVLTWGTGAINVDGCRVPSDDSTVRNNTAEMGYSGGNLPGQYSTGSDLGRWPANILHDGSDEVVELFPGDAARFFYCAKASKTDRNEGLEHLPHMSAGEVTGGRAEGSAGLDSPRAGAGRTAGSHNHHPTVKPAELMRWCCRLITPPGGHIIDPFAGSGSTGKAALLEGFDVTLCEREAEYLPIIDARCALAAWQHLTK